MRCSDIKLTFNITYTENLIQKIEDAVPEALMETMVYYHGMADPMVPIDTGDLRLSFEMYMDEAMSITGQWLVYDKGFAYGAYQHEHHAKMAHWSTNALNMYKGNMLLVFQDTLRRGL